MISSHTAELNGSEPTGAQAFAGQSRLGRGLSGIQDEVSPPSQPSSSHREQHLAQWCQEQEQLRTPFVDDEDGLGDNLPLSDDEDLSPFHAAPLENSQDPTPRTDAPADAPSGGLWKGVLKLESNQEGSPVARRRSAQTPSPGASSFPQHAANEPGHRVRPGALHRRSRLSGVRGAKPPTESAGSGSVLERIESGASRDNTANLALRDFTTRDMGMSTQRRRMARRSEPGRKAKERISAQIKLRLKAKEPDLPQNMSQPYLADLLGFCEQFSSRSRTLLQWRERADRQSTASGASSGYSAASTDPSMVLSVDSEENSGTTAPSVPSESEPNQQSATELDVRESNGSFQEVPPTTPITRYVHHQNAEHNTVQHRASLIHNTSTAKEHKVWEAIQAKSKFLHSKWLGEFQNEQIENRFVASSLLQHQPSFWPMPTKVGLYAALAANLWRSLPSSLSPSVRAAATAVLVMCTSAARVPLGAAVRDPAADPSWTRVVPVGAVGMLLEALHPARAPLSLAAYALLLMTCGTVALQTPRSLLVTLAALAAPLAGELCRTGLLLSTLVSLRALLLCVFASVLLVSVRRERRRSRMLWQSKYMHHKRSKTLSSVWHDLVPSVSAREFIFERRIWMDFSEFNEETLLQRYSLWVQMDSSHAVVLAMDMVNFTPLANSLSPCQVVRLLHEIWCLVDACVRDPELVDGEEGEAGEQNAMFKMDTIGDAYITVHLVEADSREMQAAAIERVMQLAANVQSELLALSVWKSCAGEMELNSLRFRMGLSCDPVVAGVVGLLQPRYHVFGAAVENARNLEARAGGGMLRVQDSCLDMLPWLHGVNMLNLEIFNDEDIPALVEMNNVVMEMLIRNGQEIKRPAIHRKLRDYLKAADDSRDDDQSFWKQIGLQLE